MLKVCDAVKWGFPCFHCLDQLMWDSLFCESMKKNQESSKFKSFDVQWHFYRCCHLTHLWVSTLQLLLRNSVEKKNVLVSWVKLFEFQAYSALNFHWNHNLTKSIWKQDISSTLITGNLTLEEFMPCSAYSSIQHFICITVCVCASRTAWPLLIEYKGESSA